ncbi:MAG: hydantoinase/oxoprolinase family protein, partial [Pseudomonadota bacterium]
GWLTGLSDAIVSDIGGTTTDIAVLRGGRPKLDPAGAEVGGLRTLVEAVAMRTHGLGGDSEVGLAESGLEARLTLGPRRVIPVSLLARDHGAVVHQALDRALSGPRVGELDGRFLIRLRPAAEADGADAALLARLAAGPLPAGEALRSRPDRMAAKRLISRGVLGQAALTPSDASHVLGLQEGWDREAARKACQLFAARRGNDGRAVAEGAEPLAQRIRERLVRLSAERVLDAALTEDGFAGARPAETPLAQAALERHLGLVRPTLDLTLPLIGLGASAEVYYPAVAELLAAEPAIPTHADVANAVGAVVGLVRITREATITVPHEGLFRAHLPGGPVDLVDEAEAEARTTADLARLTAKDAREAGAAETEITTEINRRTAEIEGHRTLVETRITVTATGRPRLAEPAPSTDLPGGFVG